MCRPNHKFDLHCKHYALLQEFLWFNVLVHFVHSYTHCRVWRESVINLRHSKTKTNTNLVGISLLVSAKCHGSCLQLYFWLWDQTGKNNTYCKFSSDSIKSYMYCMFKISWIANIWFIIMGCTLWTLDFSFQCLLFPITRIIRLCNNNQL